MSTTNHTALDRFADPWGHNFPWGTPPIASEDDLLGSLLEEADPDTGERDWQERGLCSQTDPEAFFPEKGGSIREAKQMCLRCEVTAECLEYALANDERFGVWGGLSERERRKLKQRNQPQQP